MLKRTGKTTARLQKVILFIRNCAAGKIKIKMKSIILMVFGFALYSAAGAQDMPGMKMPVPKKETKSQGIKTNKSTNAETALYTCVMHPKIQKDKPGKCPKCGMTLVKMNSRKGSKSMGDMKM